MDTLTIQGKNGVWPLITSSGAKEHASALIAIQGKKVVLDRLVLLGITPMSDYCIKNDDGHLGLRRTLVCKGNEIACSPRGRLTAEDCILLAGCGLGDSSLKNCLALGTRFSCMYPAVLDSCTIQHAELGHAPTTFTNCIVGEIGLRYQRRGYRIDHCAAFGEIDPLVERGEGCFLANPQFIDPKNLDYRLMPTSPCTGKASDGGDLGCRYTPEMIKMLQIALKLRAQGIIKF